MERAMSATHRTHLQATVRGRSPSRASASVAIILAMSACGPSEDATGSPDRTLALPAQEWTVGVPAVAIGVAEGDARYLLHEIASVLRLDNGNIAVLSAGSTDLRFYDPSGRHVRTVGGKGRGPGEFIAPARIYRTHPDSLLVFDSGTGMESRFDTTGAFVWAERWEAPPGETFGRDAWLHGRTLVDGPRRPEARGPIRRLFELAPAGAAGGFRSARVDDWGRVWLRDEPQNPEAPSNWRVYSTNGEPLARVTTPGSFEIQYIGSDYVAGRAWDGLGVQSAVIHELKGAVTASLEEDTEAEAPATTDPAAKETVLQTMRSLIRNAMMQQELFHGNPENGYRYAWRADQLEWPDDMTGVSVHIIASGPRGYTMLAVDENAGITCGVSVGFGGPIGWTPGRALCG
jgi:hypothetical protein